MDISLMEMASKCASIGVDSDCWSDTALPQTNKQTKSLELYSFVWNGCHFPINIVQF